MGWHPLTTIYSLEFIVPLSLSLSVPPPRRVLTQSIQLTSIYSLEFIVPLSLSLSVPPPRRVLTQSIQLTSIYSLEFILCQMYSFLPPLWIISRIASRMTCMAVGPPCWSAMDISRIASWMTCMVVGPRRWAHVYSIPNVLVSSTAMDNFSNSISNDVYGGRSTLLKHVWARGRLVIRPHFSIQNFLGPLLPRSAANPS